MEDWLVLKHLLARIAWIAFAIAPPSYIVVSKWEQVRKHSFLAIAIFVMYEIIVLLGKLFSRASSQVYILWSDRFAQQLDTYIGRKLTRFERKYKHYIRSKYRFLDQQGLQTIGAFSLDLGEVFIDMGLAPESPGKISGSPITSSQDELRKRSSIWEYLKPHNSSLVLAVIAGPGSGKSTLLAHMALDLCSSKKSSSILVYKKNKASEKPKIPILLFLRDHAAKIVANPELNLTDILSPHIAANLGGEPAGWFSHKLKRGRCLVMLDGLDEVAKKDDRQEVVNWVTRQVHRYNANSFVVTSRPGGYKSTPLSAATVLKIRSLNSIQVADFIHSWCFAVTRRETGMVNIDRIEKRSIRDRRELENAVRIAATSKAEALIEKLDQRPELTELTVNPLLLTMIANVHHFKKALPGSRSELYADICEALLWTRQDAKGIVDTLRPEQKILPVQSLAYSLMDRGIGVQTHEHVIKYIESELQFVNSEITPSDFIDLIISSGLLVEQETGMYAFSHQTFQEYLSASYIRENNLVGKLIEHVGDPWWREATLLYVARSDATDIVDRCLSLESADSLSLAIDCYFEASLLSPGLRTRVKGLLDSAPLMSLDDPMRRPLLSALISHWLRDTISLRSGGRICKNPVPEEYFQYFLADFPSRRTVSFPVRKMNSSDLAIGMRGSDALLFAEWITDLTNKPFSLPIASDVNDAAYQRQTWAARYSVWLHPTEQGERCKLHVPNGLRDPLSISRSTLFSEMAADIDRDHVLACKLALFASVSNIRVFYAAPGDVLVKAFSSFTSVNQMTNIVTALKRARSDAQDPDRAAARLPDRFGYAATPIESLADLDRKLSADILLAELARTSRASRAFERTSEPMSRLQSGLLAKLETMLSFCSPCNIDSEDLAKLTTTTLRRNIYPEYLINIASSCIETLEDSAPAILRQEAPIGAANASRIRLACIQMLLVSPWVENRPEVVQLVFSLMESITLLKFRQDARLDPSEIIALVRH